VTDPANRPSPTRSASRWPRQRARQARQLALGLVAGDPGRLAEAPDAAKKFIDWATNKDYLALVASKEGWANVPPGTRTSLYANPEYSQAAPFAKMTLDSINAADPTKSDREAGALCRRPVRRDPRIPGPRHHVSASSSRRRWPAR
jgi:hypothetical protein